MIDATAPAPLRDGNADSRRCRLSGNQLEASVSSMWSLGLPDGYATTQVLWLSSAASMEPSGENCIWPTPGNGPGQNSLGAPPLSDSIHSLPFRAKARVLAS